MKIVVLDADTLGRDLDLTVFDRFGACSVHGFTSSADIAQRISSADVVVTNKMRLNSTNLSAAVHLRLICVTGTGTDGIDKSHCLERGIGVCNIRGYSTSSVVMHTFTVLFSLMERIDRFASYTRTGSYIADTSFRHLDWTFHDLSGFRFGIIGMGTIGRAVARAGETFGCEPVYWSSQQEDRDPEYQRLDLATLLRTSDVVSIHSPLHERTRGLIGPLELSWMKRDAYLLNMGRGGIIDEAALAGTLLDGRLAGCGIDVLEEEPMSPDSPLCQVLGCDRLLLTPHIAWASIEARRRCILEVVRNIEDFLAGGRRNRVES